MCSVPLCSQHSNTALAALNLCLEDPSCMNSALMCCRSNKTNILHQRNSLCVSPPSCSLDKPQTSQALLLSCWFLLPRGNESIGAGIFLELHYSRGKDSRHTTPLKLHFWKLPVAGENPWSWQCWLGIAGSVLYLLSGCCKHWVDFLIYFFNDMTLALAFCMGFCASLSQKFGF